MPHFILEYSNNVCDKPTAGEFFSKLHTLLGSLGPFQLSAMKSRIVKRKEYCVSDGTKNQAFVHLELSILSGRDEETKARVSKRLLQLLRDHFPETAETMNCSFSVEVRDIESSSYSKESSGEL
ncbi:MAG: 5-carboxymethyl-2-hydroxymuconate Delta-isomerase [Bdellovibrionales bacterium]|nr:5-carboxymethyl-2-hydroxymuconate Delta-isomerase [Bdellovibrionales bacterium]